MITLPIETEDDVHLLVSRYCRVFGWPEHQRCPEFWIDTIEDHQTFWSVSYSMRMDPRDKIVITSIWIIVEKDTGRIYSAPARLRGGLFDNYPANKHLLINVESTELLQ